MTKKKPGSKLSTGGQKPIQSMTLQKTAKHVPKSQKTLPQDDLKNLAKVKWSSLQNDLHSALDIWAEDTAGHKTKSPEEEQLDKVKTLIEDLKQKLSDF